MRKASGDRVYEAIKARVIAYDFPEGERIYLQPIADDLGVSTMPVREAFNRLAAEDLVIKAPRKGFIAKTLSEEDLRGHYDLTRLLLVNELEVLDAAARQKLTEFEPIATVLYKLIRRAISDANTLATYTGEIFALLASFGGNDHVRFSIGRANDHLHYIRTLECQHLHDVQSELVLLCELILAGRSKELIDDIHRYHDQRIELLPVLLRSTRRWGSGR